MFVVKAGNLPWSGAHERYFTRVDSFLPTKYSTRQEKLARDEHYK
jgi:hypothetical protein